MFNLTHLSGIHSQKQLLFSVVSLLFLKIGCESFWRLHSRSLVLKGIWAIRSEVAFYPHGAMHLHTAPFAVPLWHLSLDNTSPTISGVHQNMTWEPIKWFVCQGSSRPLPALYKNSPTQGPAAPETGATANLVSSSVCTAAPGGTRQLLTWHAGCASCRRGVVSEWRTSGCALVVVHECIRPTGNTL